MRSNKEQSFEQLLEEERLLLEATELIEKLMEDRGVNRKELADLLGKSKAHVTQLLSGDRNVTLRTLAELAFVLDRRIHLDSQSRSERPNAWYRRVGVDGMADRRERSAEKEDWEP